MRYLFAAVLFLVSSSAFGQACNPATGQNCTPPPPPPAPVCTQQQKTCVGGNPATGQVGTCTITEVVVPCVVTPPPKPACISNTGQIVPCT